MKLKQIHNIKHFLLRRRARLIAYQDIALDLYLSLIKQRYLIQADEAFNKDRLQ